MLFSDRIEKGEKPDIIVMLSDMMPILTQNKQESKWLPYKTITKVW